MPYFIITNLFYRCDLCGKILVRRRDLERHLKSRHMVEMHPGQNILPDSPVAPNEDSNSTEIVHIPDEKSQTGDSTAAKLEDTLQPIEEDVKIIIKRDVSEAGGDGDIS